MGTASGGQSLRHRFDGINSHMNLSALVSYNTPRREQYLDKCFRIDE